MDPLLVMCHESEVVIHIYPFTHWFHRNLVTNSVSCDILAKLHATYDFCPAMHIKHGLFYKGTQYYGKLSLWIPVISADHWSWKIPTIARMNTLDSIFHGAWSSMLFNQTLYNMVWLLYTDVRVIKRPYCNCQIEFYSSFPVPVHMLYGN